MMYSVKDKHGNDVDKSLYSIDLENKRFSSNKLNNLVIDFSGLDGWSFDTLSYCEFKTGNNCKFDTLHNCKFKTGNYCKFETLFSCKFKTGDNCEFITGFYCTFKTGNYCNLIHYGKEYKLSKGFCFVDDYLRLHKDIDENWALLNTKHNDEFIRDVCKFILRS